MAVVMLCLEILHFFGLSVVVPGLPLLAAVVCTGFSAGMGAGLVAAVVGILYELLTFSETPHWFTYTAVSGIRIALFSVSAVMAAVLAGILRKRVEATTYALAHRRALEMWHEETGSLQSVLHQVPMGVLVADAATGDITFANDKARSILGDDIGRLHSVGFPSINRIDNGRSYSPDEWPLRRWVATRMAVEDEFLYVRVNGQIAVIHARTCPVYDQAGRVIVAVMSLTDGSEIKRVERRLAEVTRTVGSSEASGSNGRRQKQHRYSLLILAVAGQVQFPASGGPTGRQR